MVQRARRLSDGLVVAVKFMRSDDPELLDVSRKEYELLKSIQHPHIIKALDFHGIRNGTALILEYFESKTLAQVPRRATV